MPLKAFGFCYLMIMLIIAGCKKDLTTDLPDTQLSELKNWYDTEKAKSTAKTGSLPGLTPLWNTVISFEDDKGNLVCEVSLDNRNHIFSVLKEIDKSKSQEHEKRSLFKLVLIKDKSSGAISGAYMNIIAADNKQNLQAIHYKKAAGFNGNIQYYYINGAFNIGWHYTNGKIDIKYTAFNPFGKGVHTETTIPCGTTPRYANFCFELEGGGESCESKIIGYDQKECQVMSDNPYDGEGEEGGFVPGGPEEPTDNSKGKNFGVNPNCQNCQIRKSDMAEFLAYAKGAGMTVDAPYHTTVTLENGDTHEGTMTIIRDSNGDIQSGYFEPDKSSNIFEVGYVYNLGNGAPSTSGNSSSTTGTLYIGTGGQIVGFDSQLQDAGGGLTYTQGTYNEFSPIYIPNNFNIEYTQEWYDTEDELGSFITEFTQQGIHDTDPIPEMYYKNGTGIDMRPASPKNGLTIKNAPRNKDYFWKELAAKRPEMFSPENRAKLALPKPIAPTIDDQWIKYNPTHKAYKFDKLIHHHDEQDYMAYAIPQEVHRKWTKILHDYKLNGKLPSLSGKLNTLISVMQIFSIITDVRTSNPDAWVNWFAQQNETGKIYPDPANNKYWEIMDQTIYKNSAGIAVRAVVHYNVYADFIWDSNEHRYMGVIKLNEFTEDVDLINKTSKEVVRKWL